MVRCGVRLELRPLAAARMAVRQDVVQPSSQGGGRSSRVHRHASAASPGGRSPGSPIPHRPARADGRCGMSAVVRQCSSTGARGGWAQLAVVHIHCMAPWWDQIHDKPRRRPVRTVGNVTFLPPPIAGYRIRHHAGGAVVEIKPSRAPAMELCRCTDADAARLALAAITADHGRPFLGEIGAAA
jgi:hypothetical protein